MVVAGGVAADAVAVTEIVVAAMPPGMFTLTVTGISTLPPSATVVGSPMPMVTCAEAEPAPSANAAPNKAIHFGALRRPLAKTASTRIAQPPSGSSAGATLRKP